LCLNASWEADIIILSGLISMMKMLLKNKGGCYCKIITLWKMKMILLNRCRQLLFLIFPHSKIVEIINVSGDKMARISLKATPKALIPFRILIDMALPPSYLS
jgi:hypothetical protein